MHLVAEKIHTPEDLQSMPDGKNDELVDGHLVERNVSQLSSRVGGRTHRILDAYVDDHKLGWAWPSNLGYQCYSDDPSKVRMPDGTVSLLREGDELSGEEIIPGFRCPVASLFPAKPQPQQPEPTV